MAKGCPEYCKQDEHKDEEVCDPLRCTLFPDLDECDRCKKDPDAEGCKPTPGPKPKPKPCTNPKSDECQKHCE